MRIFTIIVQLALIASLLSCEQHATSDVDPKLGLDCFKSHRASLLPGTQHEGIEKLAENILFWRLLGVYNVKPKCALCSAASIIH